MEEIQKNINERIDFIKENEDAFIFETIRHFTDGVFSHEGIIKIPKKLLERALICFREEHPQEFEYLLKMGDDNEG